MNPLEIFPAAIAVFLLGIQTSISPCPLATNIAAVSYMGREAANSKKMILFGLCYTVGRTSAYVVLSLCLIMSVRFSADRMIRFFQVNLQGYLGPALILIGMVLANLISFSLPGVTANRLQTLSERLGIAGAFLIGVIFALAFCPTSAASFLIMVGLATRAASPAVLPLLYGVGTAIPVLLFALILAFNVRILGKAFQMTSRIDRWLRLTSGVLFILAGLWLSARNVYGLW